MLANLYWFVYFGNSLIFSSYFLPIFQKNAEIEVFMYHEIAWQVELTVPPQLFHNFIVLTQEMTVVAAREKGILIYERFWSHDLNTVFLYERYVNSQAAIAHLQLFQNQFSHRFTQIAKRERFLVFGEPSDELKAMLHSYGATFLESIDRLIR